MKKKTIVLVLLTLVIVGLGTVALLTALKLQQKQPIAPTARVPSKAAAPICTLAFAVEASPTPTPTPTATPVPACQSSCTTTSNCPTNLVCSNEGKCINAACSSSLDCVCATPTPTPTATPTGTPQGTTTPGLVTEVPQPELPEAGVSWPTIGLFGAGGTSLLLGILTLLL